MGYCWDKLLNTKVTNDARQDLARKMATEAVVMLKNEGNFLPLTAANAAKIALVGSTCNSTIKFDDFVNWPSPSYYHIGGSGRVVPKGLVTIADAVEAMCASRGDCTVTHSQTDISDDAATVGNAADVVIMCSGAMSAEEMDRATLKVDHEEFLVNVSKQITKKKVVLTMTPGTIVMPWINDVDAALTVFNPGKYAGNAFADTLWGVHNPSGRSPIYYPVSEAKPNDAGDNWGPTLIPITKDPATNGGTKCHYTTPVPIPYNEKLCIAWYCPGDRANILYPFGHGLSYTTFTYTNPKLVIDNTVATECPNQDADKGAAVACITVDVANTGSVPGTEIAQLYMKFPDGLGEPPKVLRGFHRFNDMVAGAAAEKASFPIYKRDLQTYSNDLKGWQDHTGEYVFYISQSEANVKHTLTYNKETLQVQV